MTLHPPPHLSHRCCRCSQSQLTTAKLTELSRLKSLSVSIRLVFGFRQKARPSASGLHQFNKMHYFFKIILILILIIGDYFSEFYVLLFEHKLYQLCSVITASSLRANCCQNSAKWPPKLLNILVC